MHRSVKQTFSPNSHKAEEEQQEEEEEDEKKKKKKRSGKQAHSRKYVKASFLSVAKCNRFRRTSAA